MTFREIVGYLTGRGGCPAEAAEHSVFPSPGNPFGEVRRKNAGAAGAAAATDRKVHTMRIACEPSETTNRQRDAAGGVSAVRGAGLAAWLAVVRCGVGLVRAALAAWLTVSRGKRGLMRAAFAARLAVSRSGLGLVPAELAANLAVSRSGRGPARTELPAHPAVSRSGLGVRQPELASRRRRSRAGQRVWLARAVSAGRLRRSHAGQRFGPVRAGLARPRPSRIQHRSGRAPARQLPRGGPHRSLADVVRSGRRRGAASSETRSAAGRGRRDRYWAGCDRSPAAGAPPFCPPGRRPVLAVAGIICAG